MASSFDQRRGVGRFNVGAARVPVGAAAHLYGHGARWAVTNILLENPPRLPNAAHHNDLDRRHRLGRGHGYTHRLARRPDKHRDVVRVRAGVPGSDCAQAYSPRTPPSISRPLRPAISDPRLALLSG